MKISEPGIVFHTLAAVLFASATVVSVEVFDKEEVSKEIDRVKQIILNRTKTFRDEISALSPNYQIYHVSAVFDEFELARAKKYTEIRTAINSMIDYDTATAEEKACRSYWIAFAHKSNAVESLLSKTYMHAFKKMEIAASDELTRDYEALGHLRKLKDRANTCSGAQCDDIKELVENIMVIHYTEADKFVQNYRDFLKEPSYTTTVLNNKDYIEYLELEKNFYNQTLTCLQTLRCSKS